MKKLILFSMFTFQVINAFSQNTQPNYALKDACEESKDNCWKLDLCWNEDLQDYSTVGTSDILFMYFPDKNSSCSTNTTYRLKPTSGSDNFAVWQYKDANINIRVRMQMVDSFFGYQLFDVSVKNTLVNACQPKTFNWKD
jgi:hypothetical protein